MRSLRFAGHWSEAGGFVLVFFKNLVSVAVKMPHLMYTFSKCYKFCYFNATCEDNAAVKCSIVQHKVFIPFNMTGWSIDHVDEMRLRLRTAATNGPIAHAQVIYEHGKSQWDYVDRGKLIRPPERSLAILPAESSSSKLGCGRRLPIIVVDSHKYSL
jgi:hypothetical protein